MILLPRESNGAVCRLVGLRWNTIMESKSSEYRMRHSREGEKKEQIEDKGDTEEKIITGRRNLQSCKGEP